MSITGLLILATLIVRSKSEFKLSSNCKQLDSYRSSIMHPFFLLVR